MAQNFKTIHCERGNHSWDWPVKRGRQPASCAVHPADPQERKGPSEAQIKTTITRVTTEHSERGLQCRCDFSWATTWEDLRSMGAGCTAPEFVCATLDSVRRQVDRLR